MQNTNIDISVYFSLFYFFAISFSNGFVVNILPIISINDQQCSFMWNDYIWIEFNIKILRTHRKKYLECIANCLKFLDFFFLPINCHLLQKKLNYSQLKETSIVWQTLAPNDVSLSLHSVHLLDPFYLEKKKIGHQQ